MSILLYCGRCKVEIPMLDEAEYARIKSWLQAHGRTSWQDFLEGISFEERQARREVRGREALDVYLDITGHAETNVGVLEHHRASLLGPPCSSCGKPLRTPRAKLCADCWQPR